MRVAVVSPYAIDVPGGVQAQVIGLAEQLGERGHEAFVVGPDAASLPGAHDVGSSVGIRANGAVAPVALLPAVARRTRRAIEGADVVHVHEPFVPMVGWAALRSMRPLVLTFHADPSRLIRSMYRVARPLAHRLIPPHARVSVVSEVARGAVSPLVPEVEVIPNALDVRSYSTSEPRSNGQVAFLGRPEPRKGLDVLLTGWSTVRQAIPEAELVVMGGGAHAPTDGVRFVGRVDEDEKRRLLATSAVFCAPNRGGESFGITVAEGMAAGCAVVASDLPAFLDVLGGTGRTFATGSSDALAAALIEVLESESLRTRLSEEARARAERFDWSRVTDAYIEIYRAAIDQHAGV